MSAVSDMVNLNVYREVKTWKRPVHLLRTLIAKLYLKLLPQIEVIGITGSVGKTLTQNALASVLSQKFRTVVGDENLDPTFRIPKVVLATKPWHQKMVIEYGIEHPGDMDHYLAIVKPRITVVTIISPTHTKYFKDIEGVFKEKVKLIRVLPRDGCAILNAADPLVAKMANYTKARIFWYGQRAKNGIKISHFSQNMTGSKFRLHYNGQKATVSWKIVGEHQLLSAYAAATVGIISGLTLKQIAKGLSQTKTPTHRLNAITSKNLGILDDTYNASPKAAEESLTALIALGKRRLKIAVFGEMKDLGRISHQAHFTLGSKVAKSKINYLITIGNIAKMVAKSAKKNGFAGKIFNVHNTNEALVTLAKITNRKSLVLVKGSRHAHLERIIQGLLGKSTCVHCYHCGVLK